IAINDLRLRNIDEPVPTAAKRFLQGNIIQDKISPGLIKIGFRAEKITLCGQYIHEALCARTVLLKRQLVDLAAVADDFLRLTYAQAVLIERYAGILDFAERRQNDLAIGDERLVAGSARRIHVCAQSSALEDRDAQARTKGPADRRQLSKIAEIGAARIDVACKGNTRIEQGLFLSDAGGGTCIVALGCANIRAA